MYGTLQIERSMAVVAETTITGTVNLMENAELILSGKCTQFILTSSILLMTRQTVTLLIGFLFSARFKPCNLSIFFEDCTENGVAIRCILFALGKMS